MTIAHVNATKHLTPAEIRKLDKYVKKHVGKNKLKAAKAAESEE